jgi:hypothetical protein
LWLWLAAGAAGVPPVSPPADAPPPNPLSEAPARASAPDVLGLPAYTGGATEKQFEGPMTNNDVPMDVQVHTTRDDIQLVMNHLVRTFEERNMIGTARWQGPNMAYIGYFDSSTQSMRTITAVGMPSGGTLLVFGSMDPRSLLERPAPYPEDLPPVEGIAGLSVTAGVAGKQRNRTVSFSMPGRTAAEAAAVVGRALLGSGWTRAPELEIGKHQMQAFRRREARCMMRTRDKQDRKGVRYASVIMVVTDAAPNLGP